MKNIHTLPTHKSSTLVFDTTNKKLYYSDTEYKKTVNGLPQNLYITSDEEIKKDDYYYTSLDDAVRKGNTLNLPYHHKIILTTDQELINDGVQAIDDEFLEWFVNNPSCEEVKLENHVLEVGYNLYKIIIPKEERSHYLDELPNIDKSALKKMFEAATPILHPKDETLEEAAMRCFKEMEILNPKGGLKQFIRMGVNFGAKWQAERMYSEEEVLSLLTFVNDRLPDMYSRFDPREELDEYLKQKHEEN